MSINGSGKLVEDIAALRDLKEGDYFRFAYESEGRIRYLSQKGRIEGYCPILNDYGSSISGDEVYLLSAKIIKLDLEIVQAYQNKS